MISITGTCQGYNTEYRCFQVDITKAEHTRLQAAYSRPDDTYSALTEFVGKDGKTNYRAKIKVPKERSFSEALFNQMYFGAYSIINVKRDEYEFMNDGKLMKGTTFTMISIKPRDRPVAADQQPMP